ncbi:Protein pangolin, isoforms A/H/I [Harpegnathos saltator]|uniref:Protein pangolin, isoforms A/H/I n=1 Tax=Harpegnathos saltator TaxID=610380 RepID=E2BVJ2_HARSA|nr:Protein pangolin, isoforms A/H/I [Harpegnathos saltator]
MPHVSSSGGGDDLGSEDEVKVFKDEGEEEKRSSENLTEDKSDLIDLTESEEKGSLAAGSYATTGKASARSDLSPVFGEFSSYHTCCMFAPPRRAAILEIPKPGRRLRARTDDADRRRLPRDALRGGHAPRRRQFRRARV